MILLPDSPPTIRERIIAVVIDRFQNQRRSVNGAALTWDHVSDNPMNAEQQRLGYTLGIYDTSEKKTDITGAVECRLNVVMEFSVNIAEGDNMTRTLRAVMGEVQRVATIDLNTKESDGTHLTIDVQEKGNELENMGEAATRGSGVVVFEYRYRHKPGKPWERR